MQRKIPALIYNGRGTAGLKQSSFEERVEQVGQKKPYDQRKMFVIVLSIEAKG